MICIPFFHVGYKWRDILVFQFAGSYLLQGRKCKRCGKTTFRSPSATGLFTDSQYNKELNEDKMKAAGLWSAPEPQAGEAPGGEGGTAGKGET